jgi:Spy/CpxP family protein refolding chaperone
MKTSKPSARNVLLAAVLAMPLFVMGGAARADEMGAGQLPMAQGEHGPRGPERDGPGRFGPGFGPGRPPFFHGLDLSEAQQDQIFAIVHAEAPYLREQFKAAAKAREALHALARAEKYDDAKAAALAKDLASAEANIALQHVRTQQKLLAVLTPEQRNKQADEKPRHPQRP